MSVADDVDEEVLSASQSLEKLVVGCQSAFFDDDSGCCALLGLRSSGCAVRFAFEGEELVVRICPPTGKSLDQLARSLGLLDSSRPATQR